MKLKIPVFVILIIVLMTGCGHESKITYTKPLSAGPVPNIGLSQVFDLNTLTDAAKKCALSYRDIYYSVPNYPDVSFNIPYEKMEEILTRVSALGYPVSAHDFNLSHSDQMLDFCKAIQSGKNAEIAVFFVQTYGDLTECAFKYQNKQLFLAEVETSWSYSTKKLSVNNTDFAYIDRFKLSGNGYFLYHTRCTKSCQDSSSGFRVKPISNENWNLYRKYIEPVGYLGNNLFVTTWNKKTISKLNFNDMFQYIYNLEYRKDPDYQTPYQSTANDCGHFISAVPAKDFERVITRYFPLTAQQLRQIAVYDSSRKVYPFSDYFIEGEDGLAPYAEVISSEANKDGSITMTVDVPDLNNYSDCGIQHVLTVLPYRNGNYQYISNTVKINNCKEGWFPYYSTRVSKNILES